MTGKIAAEWASEPDLQGLHQAHAMLDSDAKMAVIKLKWLAEHGSVMSMIYLGDAYKFGKGISIDLSEAEQWYRRAANAGSMFGYYLLGRLYFSQKRYDQARNAFGVAAEKNYVPALHFLGRMYASGVAGNKDLVEAKRLLERASKEGNVLAKGVLAYLLIHSPFTSLKWLRGFWLYIGMWIDLVFVVLTEGKTSDRLR